nr:MAG TPA: hypothetical protein [Caudoviricetes sp.]
MWFSLRHSLQPVIFGSLILFESVNIVVLFYCLLLYFLIALQRYN